MTETHQPALSHQPPASCETSQPKSESTVPKIHRVCIGCNNMFEVTMDNYEAKHCPACHKA